MSDLHTADLFAPAPGEPRPIAPGAVLLPGAALAEAPALLAAIRSVLARAPWRQMLTRGGFRMSVAMSNCGALGWVSDRRGYRYAPIDPDSGQPWPAMPAVLQALATDSAARAGFANFVPDACLINRYAPGARMALHQDRDEADFSQPIVSLSLGLPAIFLFGGLERSDKPARLPLAHGDVLVWGGPARLRFHGVLPVKDGAHPATGACRLNLTFRKAG
ncbi:DNA oxidative demethylase AlkB [Zoogloea sp.]|uniref:DNA oxidative demethylase AlkB n=1 Tax=Zoogloea sp. TaxID=49181 RepID=UPI00260AF4EE|nr:DNA oxidative demethylase AlkB [uncultured Zoogloea sp.]